MRSPRFSSPCAGWARPTSATRPISIPPDPVTGFCIFPRAATISRTRAPIRAGSPPHSCELPEGGGVDVQALDVDRELIGTQRQAGIEDLRLLRQRAGRAHHAPEPVRVTHA
jgi:hypothetical protein